MNIYPELIAWTMTLTACLVALWVPSYLRRIL